MQRMAGCRQINAMAFEMALGESCGLPKNRLQEVLEAYIQREQVSPVVDTVRFLPKDELVEMAETLVNLTSFRQRMSPDAETVGGPVDVAVISRGDGFIWIKRKHYFQAELNHQFFNNYFGSRK